MSGPEGVEGTFGPGVDESSVLARLLPEFEVLIRFHGKRKGRPEAGISAGDAKKGGMSIYLTDSHYDC